jgi:hypothetical protein
MCAVLGALALIGGLRPISARAALGPPEAEAGASEVWVILAGSSSSAAGSSGTPPQAALESALRRSLERLGAQVKFSETSSMSARDVVVASRTASSASVQVWIDLLVKGTATVYVTEGRNVFSRRLGFGGPDLDPVALDLIDVVVTDSIGSILEGRTVGVSREEFKRSLDTPAASPLAGSKAPSADAGAATSATSEAGGGQAPDGTTETHGEPGPAPASTAPPPGDSSGQPIATADSQVTPNPGDSPRAARPVAAPPEEVAESPHRSRYYGLLAGHYEGAVWGPSRIVHGPGLRVGLGRDPVRLDVTVGGRLPDTVTTGEGAAIRFESLALRVSAVYLVPLSAHTDFFVSFGAGLDLGRVTSTSSRVDLTAAPAFRTTDTLLRPAVGVERRSGRWMSSLTLGLDIDLLGSRYVIVAMPEVRPVLTPWRLRPLAALSIGFFF